MVARACRRRRRRETAPRGGSAGRDTPLRPRPAIAKRPGRWRRRAPPPGAAACGADGSMPWDLRERGAMGRRNPLRQGESYRAAPEACQSCPSRRLVPIAPPSARPARCTTAPARPDRCASRRALRRRSAPTPVCERGGRAGRQHDQHHGAEWKRGDEAGLGRGEEQQHRDQSARSDPQQLRAVRLPQRPQQDPAGAVDRRHDDGRQRPRESRGHLREVGPVAEQQEEEALGGERQLDHDALELPQRVVVVGAVQRAQPRVPADEVRVVEQEPAHQHHDQRRQVQLLAHRVEADQPGEQRQEAHVPGDAIDEVVEG